MKSALVTGASSGIGRAAARRLAREGFHVLAVGRDEQALANICREIEEAGGRAARFVADVTAADAPEAIVRRATETGDGIDVLVNAAGIIASGSVADTTDDAWDVMFDVNVRAPFRLIRAATPALVQRQGA